MPEVMDAEVGESRSLEHPVKRPGEVPGVDGLSIGLAEDQPFVLVGLPQQEFLLGLTGLVAPEGLQYILGDGDGAPGFLRLGFAKDVVMFPLSAIAVPYPDQGLPDV